MVFFDVVFLLLSLLLLMKVRLLQFNTEGVLFLLLDMYCAKWLAQLFFGFGLPIESSFIGHNEADKICLEGKAEVTQLNRIQPPYPSLHITHERLRSPQRGRALRLSHP